MKASKLAEKLNYIINIHGDQDVKIPGNENECDTDIHGIAISMEKEGKKADGFLICDQNTLEAFYE